jgi:hypothetical protein
MTVYGPNGIISVQSSGNYDQVSMTVDMREINNATNKVIVDCELISDHLNAIMNALDGLALSWTGYSSAAATDAYNNWNDTTRLLYGTQSDPGAGALNMLASGLYTVVNDYAFNEITVGNMWTQFWDQINGDPSGSSYTDSSGNLHPITPAPGSSPPPNDTTDVTDGTLSSPPYHDTAVNEIF